MSGDHRRVPSTPQTPERGGRGGPNDPPDPLAAAKTALRRQVRAARRTRDVHRRTRDAGSIAARAAPELARLLPPTRATVALYVSTTNEPGTGPLREALTAARVRVLLPVVVGEAPLAWSVDGSGDDSRHRLAEADVVLVPALAVDRAGHRLGQGGGHYDRSLSCVRPGVPVVAVLHDEEVRSAPVPAAAHDVPVDAALTPGGWHWFRAMT